MKTIMTLALVAVSALTLAACDSTGGYVDSQGPYGDERTVGNDVRTADPVFERRVTK